MAATDKQDVEATALKGVNRAVHETKVKPGWFIGLENWIPYKINNIRKKRGVQALTSPAFTSIPTVCSSCPPGELPAAQSLPIVCCYDDNTGIWSPASEGAGSLAHVKADENFWHTSCQGSGFGSGPYPDGPGILWKLFKPTVPTGPSCAMTDVSSTEAVTFTNHTGSLEASQAAQAGRSGHSDERSYVLQMGSISPVLFNGANSSPVYFGETSGSNPVLSSSPLDAHQAWTKFGTQFFQKVNAGFPLDNYLARWTIPTGPDGAYEDIRVLMWPMGGPSDPASPMPGVTDERAFRDLQANANWLYGLGGTGFGLANTKIYRINKNDLTHNATFDIVNPDFQNIASMFVFSDDLIFLLNYGTPSGAVIPWTIGFYDRLTDTTTTIGTAFSDCTGPSNFHASVTVGFQYANNFFWIADDGFKVLKVGPLVCPSHPEIPWQ